MAYETSRLQCSVDHMPGINNKTKQTNADTIIIVAVNEDLETEGRILDILI